MCHLYLEAVAVNPHYAVKGALRTSENRQLLGFKNKQIHQRDSRNIMSGQINSLVHSEKKKIERTSELSNIKRPGCPRRTTVVEDRRILSMVK